MEISLRLKLDGYGVRFSLEKDIVTNARMERELLFIRKIFPS
jgi:hypothetical protein